MQPSDKVAEAHIAAAGGPGQVARMAMRSLEQWRLLVNGAAAFKVALIEPALVELKSFERWPGFEDDLLSFIERTFLGPEATAAEDDAQAYAEAIEAFRCANAERITAARLVEAKEELEPSDLDWIRERVNAAAAEFPAFGSSDVDTVLRAIINASGLRPDRESQAAEIEAIKGWATNLPLTRWRILWYLARAMYETRWAAIAEEYRRARVVRISARLLESQMDLAQVDAVGANGELMYSPRRRLPGVVLTPADDVEYIQALQDAVPIFRSYLVPEIWRCICDRSRQAYAEHILRGVGGGVGEIIDGGMAEWLRIATEAEFVRPELVADGRKLMRVMRGLVVPGLPKGMDATLVQWFETPARGTSRSQLHLTYTPPTLPNFGRLMAEAGKDNLKRQTAWAPWPAVVSKKPNLRGPERWLWCNLAILFRDRAIEAAREGGVTISPDDCRRMAATVRMSLEQLQVTLKAWVESGDLVQSTLGRYALGDRASWLHIIEAGLQEAGGRESGRIGQAIRRKRLQETGMQKLGLRSNPE